MSYILIFLAKTLENVLATIRIIFISNHKKLIGAILNGFIALIWIYSTVSVLRNFTQQPLKIVAYTLGCLVGSYLGCFIEEKLALGDNMLTCITEENSRITDKLRELGYMVTTIDGYGINDQKKILLIMIPRKKKFRLSRLIKLIDKNATVISESASYFDNK